MSFSTAPQAPPTIDSLTPDLQYQLWERQQRRSKASWLWTAIVIAPAAAFVLIPQVNGLVTGAYRVADFFGLVSDQQPVDSLDAKKRAFLEAIAEAEGTGEDGYNVMYTFATFEDFSRHPEQINCDGDLCSDAAGKYQFLSTTWKPLADKLGLTDFSPESQDKAAIALIDQQAPEAWAQLEAGDIEGAFCAVGEIWASLPCNSYGQNPKAPAEVVAIYESKLKQFQEESPPAIASPESIATSSNQGTVKLSYDHPDIEDSVNSLRPDGYLEVPAPAMDYKEMIPGGRVSSLYGNRTRIDPTTGESYDQFHTGLDIGASEGTPILAPWDLCIDDADTSDPSGLGTHLVATPKGFDDVRVYFGHNSRNIAKTGECYEAGEVIAEIGNTGNSTGPHLHLQIESKSNGWQVDPAPLWGDLQVEY